MVVKLLRYEAIWSMGTQLEIRDLHLNPVPSDVGKDDIRRALAVYNVRTRRVKVFERTSNGTRYAFVTPDSNIDYMRMMEVRVIIFISVKPYGKEISHICIF